MELRDWAETELKAVLIEAELQGELVGGEIGDRIQTIVERLRIISQRDLPEAIANYDDVMTDVLTRIHR